MDACVNDGSAEISKRADGIDEHLCLLGELDQALEVFDVCDRDWGVWDAELCRKKFEAFSVSAC